MRELYALLAEMTARNEAGAVATVVWTARSAPRREGSKLVVRADGAIAGSVGGGEVEARTIEAALAAIGDGRCRRLHFDLRGELSACGGEVEIFVEPLQRRTPFHIVGYGHVGRAVAAAGRALPFQFLLVDDRPAPAGGPAPADGLAPADGPALRTVGPDEFGASFTPTLRDLVLVATRHHALDAAYLEALLAAERRHGSECGWVGVMASRAKAAQLRAQLRERGHAPDRLARLSMPVGLAVGAETPDELAVSILAEALAVARGAAWLRGADGQAQGLWLQAHRPPPAEAADAAEREPGVRP